MAAILGDDIKSETPRSPKSFLTSKAAIFPPSTNCPIKLPSALSASTAPCNLVASQEPKW